MKKKEQKEINKIINILVYIVKKYRDQNTQNTVLKYSKYFNFSVIKLISDDIIYSDSYIIAVYLKNNYRQVVSMEIKFNPLSNSYKIYSIVFDKEYKGLKGKINFLKEIKKTRV